MTDWAISLTKEQTEDLCQAIADANRTLSRVKNGRKNAYLVSLSALDVALEKIGVDCDNYPAEFKAVWDEDIPWGVLDRAKETNEFDFAEEYGELYRKIDEHLMPALGADNEQLVRGMVALGAGEANKP